MCLINYTHKFRILHHTLSLRNLVLGYEYGRVFPAGAGPGSPLRDAANWLPSRFSWSVETRRRYGWLRMVFPRCAPLPSSNLMPSGGGGTREAGGPVAESLVAFYRVSIFEYTLPQGHTIL